MDTTRRAVTETVIAAAGADIAVRPQPLGAFGLPLGYLLVPAGPDTEPARRALLSGNLPDEWPARLSAHRCALAGDRDGALAALSASSAVDPVTRYNRFVLDPDSIGAGPDVDELRSALGEFGALVDLVSFAVGRSDTAPEPGDTDGELAAVLLAGQASAALADGVPARAIELLDAAVTMAGPAAEPLAGMLLGAAAGICRDAADPTALSRLERALRCLDGADALRVARAELHLTAAGLLHEQAADRPELLASAIPHYHSALQLVRREGAPVLWASAHADLATAYLTMPMVEASGQLRLGVAAQSLRQALTVFTAEEHPRRWASVQLNLANSLVYTPSKHQTDNLVEAVEIYEAVLAARDRDSDPLGRARVLANQGNVLAHLGLLDLAKGKLYEARFLFEELGDSESVRTVRGVLDEVARQTALARDQDCGALMSTTAEQPVTVTEPDIDTLADRALAAVRPQLHSHGGDVTLVRIDDAVAFVRLEGACNGCSVSSVTLRELVETALLRGVPAITAVEVLPAEPTPTLIPVEALRVQGGDVWVRVTG